MNPFQLFIRELQLWRHYPGDRRRWLIHGRKGPLAGRHFEMEGRRYPYFLHAYNHTWDNERVVELPVAFDFLQGTPAIDVLEVGNVLSHYKDLGHIVVDRYERCFYRKVLNEDLLAYNPGRRFAKIVALSTIEHVGWDETPRDLAKLLRAVEHLKNLLTDNGKALISLPIGYNSFADECLASGALRADKTVYLVRASAHNEWRVEDGSEALNYRYGAPNPGANALAFCWLSRFAT